MIAVVIPSYKVKNHILKVISEIGSEVSKIIVVDDCCPEKTGEFVKQNCKDERITVLFHEKNQGVGGATITGYKEAIKLNAEIVVKLDGDGQMNPRLISKFCAPIFNGEADYTKGNRFFNLDSLRSMPQIRLIGNGILSFVNKVTSGYWNVMDPTNGYTAIHGKVLKLLSFEKIDKRYFFESDMLFRLYTIRAVVRDVPIDSHYGDENSSLRVSKIAFEFPPKYLKRFLKRIFYNYYLRDFNPASFQLVIGNILILMGALFGFVKWKHGIDVGVPATSGTVMVAALPIILGSQMLLFAINFDMQNFPRHAIHPEIE